MALHLDIVRHLDVTIMEFTGHVTLGESAGVYRNAVRDAVWEGHRKLALDYGDISYQDSTGNGELVSAYTMVANSGGELVLFDLTQRIRELLQLTKLYRVFRVFDSRDSALAYFDATRKPEVHVTERRYFHVSVLGIEGALTEEFGASKVPAAIQTSLSSGVESVIVQCPQVLEIDHAGVENLRVARRDVRKRGGELVLAGLEERLLPGMSEPGISNELHFYETVDAALGVFGLTVDRSRWRIEVGRAG
jgi:anti-sigma B factor antagonist